MNDPARRCRGALLFVSTAVAAAVIGCGEHAADSRATPAHLPTASVRVQTVEKSTHTATEEAVGTVRAKLHARIEANVAGRIAKMLVAPGQSVTAGELLAQLDVREIRAKLDQATAVRQQAESALRRETKLLEQGATTRAEYDAVAANAHIARAAVREAETMLGYAEIAAPFAGVVTRKLADVGDHAGPGRPLLEIEDPTHLRLEADLSEASMGAVSLGDELPVRIANSTTELRGTVSELAPSADPNSRTFRVKIDLPATDGLRAGQFGRVAVPVGATSTLRVPPGALVRRGQLEMVFVVVDNRAQMRLVKTGARLSDEVEILSGLEAGEEVVVEGAASLIDGQPVTVRR